MGLRIIGKWITKAHRKSRRQTLKVRHSQSEESRYLAMINQSFNHFECFVFITNFSARLRNYPSIFVVVARLRFNTGIVVSATLPLFSCVEMGEAISSTKIQTQSVAPQGINIVLCQTSFVPTIRDMEYFSIPEKNARPHVGEKLTRYDKTIQINKLSPLVQTDSCTIHPMYSTNSNQCSLKAILTSLSSVPRTKHFSHPKR